MVDAREPPSKRVKVEPEPGFSCQDIKWHTLEAANAEELADELEQGGSAEFPLEYYHQVFGQEEQILGYQELAINVWLSARTYQPWVDIQYGRKLPKADDIHRQLANAFPSGYATDRQAFEKAAAAELAAAPDWGRLGDNVLAKTVEVEGEPYELRVQHFKLVDAPDSVKALHARLQPLLLFMIDGANFLEQDDDDKWELLLAVLQPKEEEPRRGGSSRAPLVAGFATVYNFYAWPLSHRPRLSQALVLPPYQGAGIGKALVQAAYTLAQQREAVDLTFEDPSDELQRLREKVDLEALAACPWLAEAAAAAVAAAAAALLGAGPEPSADQVAAAVKLLEFPEASAARAAQELKVHPRAARVAWEALLYVAPAMQAAPGAQLAFNVLVSERLLSQHLGGPERAAEDKRLVDVADKDREFFMYRRRLGSGAGAGADACGPSMASGRAATVAEVTEDEREERGARLEELVEERMGALAALRARLEGGGQDGGEGGSSDGE